MIAPDYDECCFG